MKRLVTFFCAAAAMLPVQRAFAQKAEPAGGFGEKGTIALHVMTVAPMLASDVYNGYELGATPLLGFHTTTHDGPQANDGSRTSHRYSAFYVNPRAHWFVIDHLSIGGELLLATLSAKTITKTDGRTEETDADAPNVFGLMPVVGYDLPLGAKFSLWPQGGIGFRHAWFTHKEGNTSRDFAENWWFVALDVPFMFHPVPHIALGVGPGVTVTLSKSQSTSTGGRTESQDISTLQWRWLSAHLVAWF